MWDKAKDKGVTLEARTVTEPDPNNLAQMVSKTVYISTVEGRKQALDAAEKENKEYTERALLTLEAQRLAAQRKVLVSRVSAQAATILNEIPSAKELMVEAAAKQQPKQIDA